MSKAIKAKIKEIDERLKTAKPHSIATLEAMKAFWQGQLKKKK
jgi:hypothetical protein